MFSMLSGMRFRRRTDEVDENTPAVDVITSSAAHANVSFPTPWIQRCQTPIGRPPAGKMWSQPDLFRPKSWGGPYKS